MEYFSGLRKLRDQAYFRVPDRLVVTLKHLKHHHRFPNVGTPKTFTEHVLHRILFDRDPRLTQLVDKVGVRDFVANRAGNEFLIPLLAVADSVESLHFESLPPPFIAKASHGAAMHYVVSEGRAEEFQNARFSAAEWLQTDHYIRHREWAYRDVPRRILVEKYLVEPGHSNLVDYKFYVFHGRVELIHVDSDRFGSHKRAFYTRNGSKLGIQRRTDNSSVASKVVPLSAEVDLEQLVWLAERLAGTDPFIRVDLYQVDSCVLFGELTLYPSGGLSSFRPQEVEYELGKFWRNEGGDLSRWIMD